MMVSYSHENLQKNRPCIHLGHFNNNKYKMVAVESQKIHKSNKFRMSKQSLFLFRTLI